MKDIENMPQFEELVKGYFGIIESVAACAKNEPKKWRKYAGLILEANNGFGKSIAMLTGMKPIESSTEKIT